MALLGGVLGAINGGLVVRGRVPAIVVTLGTLYAFRGVAFLIAGGNKVNASDLPDSFLSVSTSEFLGVPIPILICIALLVVTTFVTRDLTFGRALYAVGDDPQAARLEGIGVGRTVFTAFVLCGVLTGVAGVLYALRFGTVDARAATGVEFQAVAAVVVGGVSFLGGSGTVAGAFIGAIVLAAIGNALNVVNLSPFWLQAISGAVILVAVSGDLLLRRRLSQTGAGR
jgi:rhamnose transport system permease protein